MDKKKDNGKGLRTRRQFLKVAGIGGLSAASLYLLGCAAEAVTTTKTVTTTVTGAGVTTTVTAPGTTATVTTGPGTTVTATAPGVTTTVTATVVGEPVQIAWDREVDVVVVGTGTVIPAALVAADAGLKVLMLDKAPEVAVPDKFDNHGFGGHTVMSGGGLFIPNHYLWKDAGISWPRERAFTYIKRTTFEQSTDELIYSFVDNAPLMIEWLRDNAGYTWQLGMPSPRPIAAYYYPFEEGQPWSVSPWIKPDRADGISTGAGLIKHGKEAIEARGIEVMHETPGKRLIYRGNSGTGDGEVIGIIAEDPNGQEIAIKARRGVCLGTGGFEHNPEMMRHFLRAPLFTSCSAPTNTGDGHLMGMAVGADLRNMNSIWANTAYVPDPTKFASPGIWSSIMDAFSYRGKPGAIVVNRHGERIGNESRAYAVFGRSFSAWDSGRDEWLNIPSFTIFSSDYTSHYNLPGQSGADREAGIVPDWITTSNSLSGLAAALGINAERLAATVETFNGYARDGVDPDWKRGEFIQFDGWSAGDMTRYDAGELKNPCLAVLEPPYYGAEIWPSTMGGTNGGLSTNGNAQVKNVWGNVIPRLYASGNCMASAMGPGYATGGATLGSGMTFAWLAGKHVSTLAPWE